MITLSKSDLNRLCPSRTQPHATPRWHEGTELVGYWQEADSFVFKGHKGHYLCVSRGFIESIASGEVWET